MKKLIVVLVFLFSAITVFSQIPLFVFVQVSGDNWATEVFYEALARNLDRSGNYVSAKLLDTTAEILVKGMPVYETNRDGELTRHIYYAYSIAIIFHDSEAVFQSNNTVLISYTDEQSIQWAANQSYNYLENAVEYIINTFGQESLIPSESDQNSGWGRGE